MVNLKVVNPADFLKKKQHPAPVAEPEPEEVETMEDELEIPAPVLPKKPMPKPREAPAPREETVQEEEADAEEPVEEEDITAVPEEEEPEPETKTLALSEQDVDSINNRILELQETSNNLRMQLASQTEIMEVITMEAGRARVENKQLRALLEQWKTIIEQQREQLKILTAPRKK